MFAGLEISLFVLIHRQMTLGLLGAGHAGAGRDAVVRVVPGGVPVRRRRRRVAVRLARRPLGRTRAMGWRAVLLAVHPRVLLRHLRRGDAGRCGSSPAWASAGVWPNAVALVAEAWPNASRPFLAGLLGAAANVGFVLLGVIGYCLPDHRGRLAVDVPRRRARRRCSGCGSSWCCPGVAALAPEVDETVRRFAAAGSAAAAAVVADASSA